MHNFVASLSAGVVGILTILQSQQSSSHTAHGVLLLCSTPLAIGMGSYYQNHAEIEECSYIVPYSDPTESSLMK